MNNKNLILKSQDNKGKVPLNVLGSSLKNTGYISPTNIWSNSVYSFNQNYIKNIPSVDNIVNKMIKSFFTINALDNNMDGKKSKLIQRRYKRLSLNKILVSKSEIKHSNNKVSITIYLFNKKKRSLLLSLGKLYNSLSLGFTSKSRSWKNRNNFETKLGQASFISKDKVYTINPQNGKNKTVSSLKAGSNLNIGLNSGRMFKGLPLNKYAYMTTNSELTSRKTNSLKGIEGQNNSGVRFSFINKILYYKRLNNLTKYNMYKFINYLGLNIGQTSSYVKLLKEFFVYTNKYKLYNDTTYNEIASQAKDISLNSNLNLSFKTMSGLEGKSSPALIGNPLNSFLKNPNYSISKLKSVYKLFALYNSINLETSSTISDSSLELRNNFDTNITNKVLLNTSKLLKKTMKRPEGNFKKLTGHSPFNAQSSIKLSHKNKNIGKERGNLFPSSSVLKIKPNTASIILAKKLNRIDRFLDKYKNTLLFSNIALNEIKAKPLDLKISQKLASNYKVNFINDILEKELLYIHYMKLLSYNNAVFKNWFLFSLKNLIAKLYNKKVIFNLVNLKYIHLNSDILSQAVNIRLRNFRKNKIVDVLKKAVKLVSISKVNVYACDEHSSMYKYIHNYYDKFKHLKLDIFKELGYLDINKSNPAMEFNNPGVKFYQESISTQNEEQNINNTENNALYIPCTIRRLNHIQTSTVNFIKFKSVFGVRLEAAGRLTKRSTASRAVFKFRYKGTLKNNPTINNSLSSAMVKNHQISNLQFTKISSKTRNGSFGLKGWINSN